MSDTIDPARTLSEADVAPTPMAQFGRWWAEWEAASATAGEAAPERAAVALATATADGRPSLRMVLLKGFDADGFLFFSHYTSRKGRELASNPHAALLFYWPALGRQVRAEGAVARLGDAESDTYFATRAHASRLGAWASPQSDVLASRAVLEARVASAAARFGPGDVPRPPHWGGYRLAPAVLELWQAREHRLHDRLRYRRVGGGWAVERLAP